MAVLVIEISTSSVKVMAVNAAFRVLSEHSERIRSGDGGIQRPDEICDTAFALARKTAEHCMQQNPQEEIKAVGIVSTWHNSLVADSDGRAKTPAYLWTYREPGPVASSYKRESPERALDYYRKTGCLVNGSYVSFRMKYLTENGLRFENGDRLIDQGTYLFHKLTGAFLESRSMASGTGLLSLRSLDWDPELASEMGVPLAALPELCEYDRCLPLCSGAAALLGLTQGIPVVTAHPDGAMNQVGDDALEEGIMTLSAGTSAALRMVSDRAAVPDTPSLWCYYAPGRYLTGAATAGCSNCIDWFADQVCGNRYTYPALDELAEKARSKERKTKELPVFLPFLFGERAPGWSEYRQGGFLGLSGQHDTGAMYRAVLEGICFNIRQCYEALCRVNRTPARIHVSGGILRSAIWSRILADVLQKELSLSPIQNASSLGGAKLALFAAGEIPGIDCKAGGIRETLSPNREAAEYYDRLYEVYCRWYRQTEPES